MQPTKKTLRPLTEFATVPRNFPQCCKCKFHILLWSRAATKKGTAFAIPFYQLSLTRLAAFAAKISGRALRAYPHCRTSFLPMVKVAKKAVILCIIIYRKSEQCFNSPSCYRYSLNKSQYYYFTLFTSSATFGQFKRLFFIVTILLSLTMILSLCCEYIY